MAIKRLLGAVAIGLSLLAEPADAITSYTNHVTEDSSFSSNSATPHRYTGALGADNHTPHLWSRASDTAADECDNACRRLLLFNIGHSSAAAGVTQVLSAFDSVAWCKKDEACNDDIDEAMTAVATAAVQNVYKEQELPQCDNYCLFQQMGEVARLSELHAIAWGVDHLQDPDKTLDVDDLRIRRLYNQITMLRNKKKSKPKMSAKKLEKLMKGIVQRPRANTTQVVPRALSLSTAPATHPLAQPNGTAVGSNSSGWLTTVMPPTSTGAAAWLTTVMPAPNSTSAAWLTTVMPPPKISSTTSAETSTSSNSSDGDDGKKDNHLAEILGGTIPALAGGALLSPLIEVWARSGIIGTDLSGTVTGKLLWSAVRGEKMFHSSLAKTVARALCMRASIAKPGIDSGGSIVPEMTGRVGRWFIHIGAGYSPWQVKGMEEFMFPPMERWDAIANFRKIHDLRTNAISDGDLFPKMFPRSSGNSVLRDNLDRELLVQKYEPLTGTMKKRLMKISAEHIDLPSRPYDKLPLRMINAAGEMVGPLEYRWTHCVEMLPRDAFATAQRMGKDVVNLVDTAGNVVTDVLGRATFGLNYGPLDAVKDAKLMTSRPIFSFLLRTGWNTLVDLFNEKGHQSPWTGGTGQNPFRDIDGTGQGRQINGPTDEEITSGMNTEMGPADGSDVGREPNADDSRPDNDDPDDDDDDDDDDRDECDHGLDCDGDDDGNNDDDQPSEPLAPPAEAPPQPPQNGSPEPGSPEPVASAGNRPNIDNPGSGNPSMVGQVPSSLTTIYVTPTAVATTIFSTIYRTPTAQTTSDPAATEAPANEDEIITIPHPEMPSRAYFRESCKEEGPWTNHGWPGHHEDDWDDETCKLLNWETLKWPTRCPGLSGYYASSKCIDLFGRWLAGDHEGWKEYRAHGLPKHLPKHMSLPGGVFAAERCLMVNTHGSNRTWADDHPPLGLNDAELTDNYTLTDPWVQECRRQTHPHFWSTCYAGLNPDGWQSSYQLWDANNGAGDAAWPPPENVPENTCNYYDWIFFGCTKAMSPDFWTCKSTPWGTLEVPCDYGCGEEGPYREPEEGPILYRKPS